MGKGLGKLQKCILKEIYGNCGKRLFPPTTHILQMDIQESYWGNVISVEDVKKDPLGHDPFLFNRRASISQSLRSLQDRGLIGKRMGIWYLEKEAYRELEKIRQEDNININLIND